MSKGEVEIEVLFPTGWHLSQWMAGASAAELRRAISEVRSNHPGHPIRVLRNGKVVPLPKGVRGVKPVPRY